MEKLNEQLNRTKSIAELSHFDSVRNISLLKSEKIDDEINTNNIKNSPESNKNVNPISHYRSNSPTLHYPFKSDHTVKQSTALTS